MKLVTRRKRLKPGESTRFKTAPSETKYYDAQRLIIDSLAKWHAPNLEDAEKWKAECNNKFPDQYAPDDHWDDAAGEEWNSFFTWGHDHDFGFGERRHGAMASRHIEIAAEAMSFGMLPNSLYGKTVLDIGCWSGGDLLLLSALGGQCTALESHPVSARAARHLCKLVGCEAAIINSDLYKDRKDWKQKYDLIYCSGVIYHVTDPLLLLRIAFSYLQIGGRLIIETKAHSGKGASVSFSGSLEKGWNWFAPNRQALGRWFVDAGFEQRNVVVQKRTNGRLLACAVKTKESKMPDCTGFSRPGSWLTGAV